jgi:hypothetical protein
VLGDELDTTILDDLDRRLGKRLHLGEPLLGDERLIGVLQR